MILPWKINSLPILRRTPKKTSRVGECFLYSVSGNILWAEHSNVLKGYFIQPEVAVWGNGRLRSQKLLLNREVYVWRGRTSHGASSVSQPGSDGPVAGAGLPKQDKHKETFFLSAEEEVDAWATSWFHEWLIENLLETLHRWRISEGTLRYLLRGTSFYRLNEKMSPFAAEPPLIGYYSKPTVSWEYRLFSMKASWRDSDSLHHKAQVPHSVMSAAWGKS